MHKKKLESLFFTYLEVSLERIKVGIDTTFIYYFFNPDLRIDIFFERRGNRKKG